VLATLLFGMVDQPIEKRGAKSARAIGIVRDEVIDIQSATGKKEIEDAKPCHRTDHAIQFEERQVISLSLLFQNPRDEIDRLNVGPELTHNGTTVANLLGCSRKSNFPGRWFCSGHGISSPARSRDQAQFETGDGTGLTKSWLPAPICRNVFSL
jgi:hypothetical protein